MFDNENDLSQINDAMNQTQTWAQRLWYLMKLPFKLFLLPGAIYRATAKVFRALKIRKDRDRGTDQYHKTSHQALGKSSQQMAREQSLDAQLRQRDYGLAPQLKDAFDTYDFINPPRKKRSIDEIKKNAILTSQARNLQTNRNRNSRQTEMMAGGLK